jgi:hypothetical protein
MTSENCSGNFAIRLHEYSELSMSHRGLLGENV